MADQPSVRQTVSNVLVIGTGGAGARAAIAAHDAGSEVVMLGKRPRKDAKGRRVQEVYCPFHDDGRKPGAWLGEERSSKDP